jgi:hypothetical protein
MAKIPTTKVPRYHLSVEEGNPFHNETCQVSVKELEKKQINHAYAIYTNIAFLLVRERLSNPCCMFSYFLFPFI